MIVHDSRLALRESSLEIIICIHRRLNSFGNGNMPSLLNLGRMWLENYICLNNETERDETKYK